MSTEQKRIQMRRALAATWTSQNPVLLAGEIGIEKDTGKFKFGNGSQRWNDLGYAVNTSSSASQGESSAAILYDNKIYFLDVVAKNGELISISPEIDEVADMTLTVNTEMTPVQFTGQNTEVNF